MAMAAVIPANGRIARQITKGYVMKEVVRGLQVTPAAMGKCAARIFAETVLKIRPVRRVTTETIITATAAMRIAYGKVVNKIIRVCALNIIQLKTVVRLLSSVTGAEEKPVAARISAETG
jgi:hypothetical protein